MTSRLSEVIPCPPLRAAWYWSTAQGTGKVIPSNYTAAGKSELEDHLVAASRTAGQKKILIAIKRAFKEFVV